MFTGLIRSLVDILNSICTADISAIPEVVKAYVSLLFSKQLRIAFACRSALVSLFRKKQSKKRVVIPTPPRSSLHFLFFFMEDLFFLLNFFV